MKNYSKNYEMKPHGKYRGNIARALAKEAHVRPSDNIPTVVRRILHSFEGDESSKTYNGVENIADIHNKIAEIQE